MTTTITPDLSAQLDAIAGQLTAVTSTVNQILAIVSGTTPPPAITPPAQAKAAGFNTLTFSDDFPGTSLDLTKWNPGLWYEQPVPPNFYLVSGGSLNLTGPTPNNDNYIATLSRDTHGGKSFQFGYFEAQINPTNWTSFWLLSTGHAQGQAVNCSEIDIETDSSQQIINCALHLSTSNSNGTPDEFNHGLGNNVQTPGGQVLGVWRKYGILWSASEVAWYVDDKLILSMPPYPSTAQPMFLILGVAPGGVLGGPTVNPVQTSFRSVRVWQAP